MIGIDEILRAYSGATNPGAAIRVIRRNREHVDLCVGSADPASAVPITSQTNFRLASVSKQLTAALILGLVDDRALGLDTRVRSILPELPAYTDEIKILHLLQHTSGLPDYEDLVPDRQRDQIDDSDVVVLLNEATLLFFPPGTGFRYSNTGYVLLGIIAARITGTPLPSVFEERLFKPLGMQETLAFVPGGRAVAHRAFGHTVAEGGVRLSDQSITSATLGDGGIYSSISDLEQWCRALDEGRVPGWPHVLRAFEPLQLPGDMTAPYGMGWEIRRWRGHPVHSHSGSTMGFRNFIARFPDHGLSIVALSNRSGAIPAELLAALLQEHHPDWNSSSESFLLCQQIVGLRPMDRHARPHLQSGDAP